MAPGLKHTWRQSTKPIPASPLATASGPKRVVTMTNPISQAAVDAARQVLLDEGCLDDEHYPGYRDSVVTTALEAAMPELLDQIEQLQAVVRDQRDDSVYQTRLAAVEEMHVPQPGLGPAYCTECDQLHPCDTTKAARGE